MPPLMTMQSALLSSADAFSGELDEDVGVEMTRERRESDRRRTNFMLGIEEYLE